jgi:hypothetical protein
LSASQEWEKAAAYQTYLRHITPKLSGSLRRLMAAGSLHDVPLLSIWQAQSRLTLALAPSQPEDRLLVLTYSLVAEPTLDRNALPEPYQSSRVEWLFDELSIDKARAGDWSSGLHNGRHIFSHDILLSNGWELHLRFHRLALTRPEALVSEGQNHALKGRS